MQISGTRHVRLAKYGCLRCGRVLFAPTWYKLYYNVMVCSCDASHFKASCVDVPDHVQAYWDAQFSTMSHSSYRRRLKRWTKRYLPGQLPYHEAFSTQVRPSVSVLETNSMSIREALNVLSGHKLAASLKSKFGDVHKTQTVHPTHFFENIVNFARVRHISNERFPDEDVQLLGQNSVHTRP